MNEMLKSREKMFAQVKGIVNQCRDHVLINLGASKAEIAKNCGVDAAALNKWLHDPRYMELGNLGVLAAVCGLELTFKAIDRKTGDVF